MNLLPQSATKDRQFKVNLKLTPAQLTVNRDMKRFTILRAGRKFGKTVFTRKKILDWMGPPKACIWYILPTYNQAKLIAWDDVKGAIPREALAKKPDESNLIIILKNGSRLHFMGSDNEDSLRGPAPTGVIFDEAAFHKREAWHNVVRPNLMVNKAPALFVSTPNGYNWFKDLEDEAVQDQLAGGEDWANFHYTVYDNPYISRDEIEKARLACEGNETLWRQEYMAEFESSVGRVFNAFQDTPRHIQKVDVPRGTIGYRGIDWGMRDNTGCLWGFVQNRKLHIYREHALSGLSPADQARIILEKTDESIKNSIIGHDAVKNDLTMKGLNVMWHFMNAGITPIRKSSRDKAGSRAKLNELIREDRLIIDPSCRRLRKELLGYEWKDTAMEKTDDGGDDCVDALHYLVELLQYDLFLSDKSSPKRSHEQMLKESQAEIMERQKRRPRWPMEKEETLTNFAFDNQAGYL